MKHGVYLYLYIIVNVTQKRTQSHQKNDRATWSYNNSFWNVFCQWWLNSKTLIYCICSTFFFCKICLDSDFYWRNVIKFNFIIFISNQYFAQWSVSVAVSTALVRVKFISFATSVWNLRKYRNGKTANSSISTTALKFEDVPARNAFEYLQMIYVARNNSYWPTFLLLIVWVYIH